MTNNRVFGWAVVENGQIRPEFEVELTEKEYQKRLRLRKKDLQNGIAQALLRYYGIRK